MERLAFHYSAPPAEAAARLTTFSRWRGGSSEYPGLFPLLMTRADQELHSIGAKVKRGFGAMILTRTTRQLWRAEPVAADAGTLSFCALSILWLSATVVLYTYIDQNRIMFEVSTLNAALAAALGERLWQKLGSRPARAN